MSRRTACIQCDEPLGEDAHIMCDECLFDDEGLFDDEDGEDA